MRTVWVSMGLLKLLTIFNKTAAYLFHLIQNHPFVDGNKRTASMVAMIFFASNFHGEFFIHENDYQTLILGVAQGVISKKEIARFFRANSKPYKRKKS